MAFMLNRRQIQQALGEEFGGPMESALWIIDTERAQAGPRVTATYMGSTMGPPCSPGQAAAKASRAYARVNSMVDLDVEVTVPITKTVLVMVSPDTNHEPMLFDVQQGTAAPIEDD